MMLWRNSDLSLSHIDARSVTTGIDLYGFQVQICPVAILDECVRIGNKPKSDDLFNEPEIDNSKAAPIDQPDSD